MIDNTRIRELAAEHGFKFKEQPCGEHDLNPYVFRFARALINEALEDAAQEIDWASNLEGHTGLDSGMDKAAEIVRRQAESNP